MEFGNPAEAARSQEREQQRQTQQRQAEQRQADQRQQSSSVQRQLETQRQQAFAQQQHQAQERKADGQKQVVQQDEQRKKRQTEQQRNRNEALKRQPRDTASQPQPVAQRGAATPPGAAQSMSMNMLPSGKLQRASAMEQVKETQRQGKRQVLAEKPKAGERVSTKDAAQLVDCCTRLAISTKAAPGKPDLANLPTKQEVTKALETAEKIHANPKIISQLRAAEKEAQPAPERVKQPEIERDMGR